MTRTQALIVFFISAGALATWAELAADCRERGGLFVSWQCVETRATVGR